MHQERTVLQTDASDRVSGQKRGARGGNTFSSLGHGIHIPLRHGGRPIHTKKCMSTNIFALADGHPTQETNIAMLDHRVRDPVHTVNMDLYLANQYPPSGGKIAEAGYVSV